MSRWANGSLVLVVVIRVQLCVTDFATEVSVRVVLASRGCVCCRLILGSLLFSCDDGGVVDVDGTIWKILNAAWCAVF